MQMLRWRALFKGRKKKKRMWIQADRPWARRRAEGSSDYWCRDRRTGNPEEEDVASCMEWTAQPLDTACREYKEEWLLGKTNIRIYRFTAMKQQLCFSHTHFIITLRGDFLLQLQRTVLCVTCFEVTETFPPSRHSWDGNWWQRTCFSLVKTSQRFP